jgi:hypothetical protein
MSWKDRLWELGACDGADWADKYDDAQQAWDECPRGDWMLWWLGKEAGEPWSDSRRPLVGCAATCASLAPTGDGEHELSRAWAIGAALRWADGGSSREELMAAATATALATASSYAIAAAYTIAAEQVGYAAYVAGGGGGCGVPRECADIVREWFPHPPYNTEEQ